MNALVTDVMKFNSTLHHRRSIRLRGYDYSQTGGYFVTLVTFQRQALFGEIMDGKMILSPLVEIVRAVWFQSAEIRKEIRLSEEEFVVMPNHLHGIIWIDDVGAHAMRPYYIMVQASPSPLALLERVFLWLSPLAV